MQKAASYTANTVENAINSDTISIATFTIKTDSNVLGLLSY
jgi:hypothetical protein